jgi:hypothetical protein
MTVTLTGIEAAFKAEIKAVATKLITAAVASAWSVLDNPGVDASAIATFVATVVSHFGPIGMAIVGIGKGEFQTVLTTTLTELGAAATEETVIAYALKHLGLS